MKRNEILRLEIEDLAYGGRGVARHEGRVIFVEGGLPGDIVDVTLIRLKRSYCEGMATEVVRPAPHRVKPLCRHFGICGGCKWQNYDYPSQLKYKEEQLRQQLIHLAGIQNPPVEPIIAAKKLYYYRNKMEYSFGIGDGGGPILGLHQGGSFDKIFDMQKCHLQSELANEIVLFVKNECRRLNLPSYHIVNHEGLLRFLIVREGKFTNQTMVNLVTGNQYEPYKNAIMEMGNNLIQKFPLIRSLYWTINSQKANIARWDKVPDGIRGGLLSGHDHILERLGDCRFRISPDSFFQTNSYQAQILYDAVIDLAELTATDRVLDLYCGTGTIAIYIAGRVNKVIGVESVSRAIDDATLNARENGIPNVEFLCGPVEDIVDNLPKPEKLIVDPPRAGLHPRALEGILELAPPMIIYVSCNPSTLARDINIFAKNGYNLQRAVAIDMFPHTYHIEAVTKMVRD
jgi:23S rRNA (uracil1939-C5)-methyltransferase